MKKTIILALILLMIPVVYTLTSSSTNFKTLAAIGLGGVTEHASTNYKTMGIMVNQPIGKFQSANFKTHLGLYPLLPLPSVSPPVCVQPPSGLVSWWPGDGNADDISDGNPGTLMNGVTFAPGKVGQAFSFDGVDDYVEIPYDPIFNLSNFTLEAWIKFTQDDAFARIISRPSDGNPTDGFSFFTLSNAFGKIGGGVQGEGQAFSVSVSTAPFTFADNNWHMANFVRDVTANNISIYVDGVLYGSFPDSSPGDMDHNFKGIFIGSTDGSKDFFEGLIDEIEIYNRALTAPEIQSIFNADSAGKCKQSVAVCIDPDSDTFGDPGTNLLACTGSTTQADNCPSDFNPDQLDTDNDGIGDVCDVCPADATDTCDVTESESATINESGGTVNTSSGNAEVDIPSGALTNDTSISVSGSNETPTTNTSLFQIQTNTTAVSLIYSFEPEGTNFSVPVTITLKYDDTGIDESTIDIYFFNTTTGLWEAQGAACDTVLNECILTVDHFSDFIVGGFADTDGDGVLDIDDSCPLENATGLDANQDGCKDTIEALINVTKELNLKQGISNSLDAKLQNTKDALEAKNAGKRQDAINKLEAFINAVEAQREKELSNEQADLLISMTNNVIAQIL